MESVDVIIPRRRALRELLFCSPVTAWRRERELSDWPKPIEISKGRSGYRMSDIRRYLDSRKPPVYPTEPAELAKLARDKAYRVEQARRAALERRQNVAARTVAA